ncbi:hypothetical protein PINS_up009281 [Pythium insidiosum]|nr:hypothetical protein PINS_up009281 [Pythium insidiosum]
MADARRDLDTSTTMMRAKRPRTTTGRARAMSEDLGDDHLMHMDPSLMTERQQLAFLLRKTAQEQSGAESPTNSSESSGDEAHLRPSRKKATKKRIPRATSNGASRSSPRSSRTKTTAVEASHAKGRNARQSPRQLHQDTEREDSSGNLPAVDAESVQPHPAKKLRVKTTSPTAAERDASSSVRKQPAMGTCSTSTVAEKTSPSSTSDVVHMAEFDDRSVQSDFWSLHCALCSHVTSPFEMSCEPLFLCMSCDKKYPTQRALGRV